MSDLSGSYLAYSVLGALQAIEDTVRAHEDDKESWDSRAFDRWVSLLGQIEELEGVDFAIGSESIETVEFKMHLAAAIGFLEAYLEEPEPEEELT
jgi:hypothetical protein